MDDFDAVTHVVPTGAGAEQAVEEGFLRIDAMIANLHNQDTSDCDPELLALAQQAIDAIAWRAYCRAWPQAMSGEGLPHPRFDHNWLTGEPAASADEIERWERSILQMPAVDFTGAGL